MLRVDVSKNFSTAASSQEGELDTSTTTEELFSTSASPSPVRVLTPVLGAAATASCPCSRSLLTSFDPMSPVPPITTIFILVLPYAYLFFEAIGLLYSLRQNVRRFVTPSPPLFIERSVHQQVDRRHSFVARHESLAEVAQEVVVARLRP